MSELADRVRLSEMLAAAEEVRVWIEGVPLDSFLNDAKLRAAVSMQLIVIGEGARLLSDEIKSRTDRVPWQDVVAMRHRLAHAYARALPHLLWETAVNKMPPLIAELRLLLSSLGPEAD